jgi:hypothetical protein
LQEVVEVPVLTEHGVMAVVEVPVGIAIHTLQKLLVVAVQPNQCKLLQPLLTP